MGVEPYRADHQCAYTRGERQIEHVAPALTNTERRTRETARAERTFVQPLDRNRVGCGLWKNCQRQFTHGVCMSVSRAAA